MKKLMLMALTAASLSAHAALIVSTDTSTSAWNDRQADPLTAVFTANSTAGSSGGITSDTSLVQTFTLGSAISAESFHIRFREGGDLGFAIHEVADPNAATLTLGSLVWSDTATLPPVGITTTFANLTLDAPVALSAGAYAFVIDTQNATPFQWRRTTDGASGNIYAGGRAYATGVNNGSANFNSGNSEFSFAVVAIPEPSSLALMAGAMALGLAVRRRRRN